MSLTSQCHFLKGFYCFSFSFYAIFCPPFVPLRRFLVKTYIDNQWITFYNTFCIGKKKYTIEDCPTILRICSRLKEDVDTSDDWNWQNIKSYMKSETSESTSVLAYAFYLHFITFFNSYQSIISKRKIKDSPSKREKQLIGDLIFFTGIIQNESISTDPDYLKTLIKRYKDYQLPNGTFTY